MNEILSTCEKNFIIKCLAGNKRLDGRLFNEFRNISIQFGSEWGCVYVALGETKVLAQVTCEITQPRATRPTEGILYINVNSGNEKRSSHQFVLLARNLERALKESRCVDLESLCIKAEEKVWRIRVDLNILNHEGNLIDCASAAALAALAHFKRPDVTTSGDEVTVHTLNERDPIPIVLHHYPVCVTYAIYENGEIVIADPSLMEERRSEATVVFGLNSYRELCGLHFGGITLASLEVLIKCANQGAKRAKKIVKQIKTALEEDEKRRSSGQSVGFSECLESNTFDTYKEGRLLLRLQKFELNTSHELNEQLQKIKLERSEIKSLGKNSAILLPAEEITDPNVSDNSKWIPEPDADLSDEFYEEEKEEEELKPISAKGAKNKKKKMKQDTVTVAAKRKSVDAISDDSEEDETMVMDTVD